MCAPALAAAAIFVASIILNLTKGDYRSIPGRALLGVFAVLIVFYLCQRDMHTAAWILIAAPFGLVLLGYVLRVTYQYVIPKNNGSDNSASYIPSGCPCCQTRPCHCIQPCPKPLPPPSPKPCPAPTPQPPGECIKPSLAT